MNPDLSTRVVAAARGWLGTPYLHQASLRGVGCDCLGLVRGVWREVIGDEPETAPAYTANWAEAGAGETLLAGAVRHLVPVDAAQIGAGSVLLFRWRRHLPAKHVGIATGPSRMVHAHESTGVCEVALCPWWRRRIAGVFEFPHRIM